MDVASFTALIVPSSSLSTPALAAGYLGAYDAKVRSSSSPPIGGEAR
jgi:hypothetical protein